MRRIKVLKLGWEFPPLINGGLGVACMGISKALSKKVDLSVIVPKAKLGVNYDGFALTGINNLQHSVMETQCEGYTYESFTVVGKAPVNLDPYASTRLIWNYSPVRKICMPATLPARLLSFQRFVL